MFNNYLNVIFSNVIFVNTTVHHCTCIKYLLMITIFFIPLRNRLSTVKHYLDGYHKVATDDYNTVLIVNKYFLLCIYKHK